MTRTRRSREPRELVERDAAAAAAAKLSRSRELRELVERDAVPGELSSTEVFAKRGLGQRRPVYDELRVRTLPQMTRL